MQPLVQYFYGGTIKRNGQMMHRLAILSRIADAHDGQGPQEFRTMFFFDESGQHVEMGD